VTGRAVTGHGLPAVQELNALPEALDALPAGFALDLAVLAAQRGPDWAGLEQWLASRIASLQLPFVQVAPAPSAARSRAASRSCSRPVLRSGGHACFRFAFLVCARKILLAPNTGIPAASHWT